MDNTPNDKELFKPDFNKEKYIIELVAAENCTTINIRGVNGYKPNYQEIIGCLETAKGSMMDSQRRANRKALREYNKKKQKLKTTPNE